MTVPPDAAASLPQIALLGLVQGLAELLPVSSSAHVIIAEKLLRLDPSSPELTFLLVMLHTGTMGAVIVYFWNAWRENYFASAYRFGTTLANVFVATAVTGVIGFALKLLIEKVFLHAGPEGKAEVEQLFSRLPLIAGALALGGVWILLAGLNQRQERGRGKPVDGFSATWIGAAQGLCLPFRGLSRSGVTISTATLAGAGKRHAEEFSFALAVVLTPLAIAHELRRLLAAQGPGHHHLGHLGKLLLPGAFGMGCSFIAGLFALWLLSRWLQAGKWHYFGLYSLTLAVIVAGLAAAGY
ncbi:MAG: undecaprenyl-diphosphate phosphatase [Verrucomicrobium sp.]|nr:undecaprenyl-diphosphate phosphatase [Verrucomicrobium sp.]